MRQSELFTKTLKEAPQDEPSTNARFLERGGFIYKNSAGIYTFLPLGWRVIQNIARIIRSEIDAIGGQEVFMPALVEKKYLTATDRWQVDIGYRVVSEERDSGRDASHVLGWTHEEVLTAIVSSFISSYKDLPFSAYQIQTKFRKEPRAKSGLLRGREFMMKDLYSFHATEEDLWRFYEKVRRAYQRIFERCGLKALYTLAAGGTFTVSNTHEFQVVSPVGEDTIFVCEKCEYAVNQEVLLTKDGRLKEGDDCPKKCGGRFKKQTAIEVGNIFPLGTKYSEAFNLKFTDETGQRRLVVMGSYGIGLGRVMGTVVEVHHDERGIIWPESIAPFSAHLLELGGSKSADVRKSAHELLAALQKAEVTVLYDDRDETPGAKFADSDLLGIPYRLVVSGKTLPSGKIEVKKRDSQESALMTLQSLLEVMKTAKQH